MWGVPIAGVEVRESPIHGRGIFAARGFDPGETILGIDDSRVVDEAHPLDASKGEFEHHCDWLGDRQVLMREPERTSTTPVSRAPTSSRSTAIVGWSHTAGWKRAMK
jgi:hypothetical protein